MAYGPLETISLILIALFFVKLFYLTFNPDAWLRFAKKVYSNFNKTIPIIMVLAVIVGYYLLQEISMVQLFAAMAFTSLLIAIGFISFHEDVVPLVEKIMKRKDLFKRATLTIIIWLILITSVLFQIFGKA